MQLSEHVRIVEFKKSLSWFVLVILMSGILASIKFDFKTGAQIGFVLCTLFMNAFNLIFVIAHFLKLPARTRFQEMKSAVVFYLLCWAYALILILESRGLRVMFFGGVMLPVAAALVATYYILLNKMET
jgi:ABC-type transport system involved in cytochrome c biogenesis permease subunit